MALGQDFAMYSAHYEQRHTLSATIRLSYYTIKV